MYRQGDFARWSQATVGSGGVTSDADEINVSGTIPASVESIGEGYDTSYPNDPFGMHRDAGAGTGSQYGYLVVSEPDAKQQLAEQRARSQAQLDDLKGKGVDVTALQKKLDAIAPPSRAEEISRLNSLFDTPLPSDISDAELTSLEHDYAPALSGTSSDAPLLAMVDVVGERNANSLYGALSVGVMRPQFMQASKPMEAENKVEAFAVGSALAFTGVDAAKSAAEIWKGPYGVKFNWATPAGYAEHYVNTGGRPLNMVQKAALTGAEVSNDARFVREADLVVDAGRAGRVAGRLSGVLGPLSWAAEGYATWNKSGHGDAGDWGHFGVSTAVLGVTIFAPAPVALAVGLAWGADYFIQDYHYQGQTGWRAVERRLW